jgi:hypothetical protein
MITQPFRHSNSRYIDADVNDPAAYEERDGQKILKDGYRVRIPVEMMDSELPVARIFNARSAPQQLTPTVIGGNNVEVMREMRRAFYPNGDAKPSREVRDRERAREQKAADVANAAVAFDAQYGGSHRPGFRFADTAGGTTNDARTDAYNQYCADLQNQWKTPERMAADTADQAKRVTSDAARPQDVSETDWARAQMIAGDGALAYHQKHVRDNRFWQQEIEPPKIDDASVAREQRDRELADAWKAVDAPAVETPPVGAYCKAGVGANEGDIVTWNGAPARLEKRGDWLFPVVHQQGATRSGASAGDAVPTSRSALDALSVADGERIKRESYEAMVSDLANAWKS